MNHNAPVVVSATLADAPRYRELRLAALSTDPLAFGSTLAQERDRGADFWTSRITSAQATLLASIGGVDLGVAVLAWVRDVPEDMGLFSVWVAPDGRGLGLGDALVEAAVDAARRAGARRLVLDVADLNAHAIALYARAGFLPTGLHTHMDPPREHVTEHQLALDL